MELAAALSATGSQRRRRERLSHRLRAVLIPPTLLFLTFPFLSMAYCGGALADSSSHSGNVVADYLNGATEHFQGDDHRQVIKQVLTDMLHEPVETLQDKLYPDYEMRPHRWSVPMELTHYIVANPPDDLDFASLLRDVKKPEAQEAIHVWLEEMNRDAVAGSRSTRPRNTVEDYLNGAEEQSEDENQRAVIKQAFSDMLNEPVASLRKKRYPDYQLHPHQWPITEVLYRYIVSDPLDGFEDDEFFRDVKKPEAQEMIQIWLNYLNNPKRKPGPPREERP